MSNEELYNQAVKAINALFWDRSVSQNATRQNLEALQDEIKTLLDTLKD